MPFTPDWYAIDTVTVTTTSGTQKDLTADVYPVMKDDFKVVIGAPPICEISPAEWFRLQTDRRALKRP